MTPALSTPVDAIQGDLIAFLSSPPILTTDGQVLSWINPEHPGFVYPEGMGLYLTLMAQLAADRGDPHITACTHRVARALQAVVSPPGGIGIRGKLYSFDTCMGVTGLLTYRRLLNGHVDAEVLARMAAFIVEMAERRCVVVNEDGRTFAVAPHWSTVFGASMLKEVIALDLLADETDSDRYRALAVEVADVVIASCLSEGAFHAIPEDTVVYTHAHCYALEGLLHLRTRGYRDTTALLRAGADRLCGWQNRDGSLFNWYNVPASRERMKVGDATAQAVRIWLAVDRDAYLPQVERALAFLVSLRSPHAGLYYCAGSRDVNSITSIFAAQAMEWYLYGPRPDAIA